MAARCSRRSRRSCRARRAGRASCATAASSSKAASRWWSCARSPSMFFDGHGRLHAADCRRARRRPRGIRERCRGARVLRGAAWWRALHRGQPAGRDQLPGQSQRLAVRHRRDHQCRRPRDHHHAASGALVPLRAEFLAPGRRGRVLAAGTACSATRAAGWAESPPAPVSDSCARALPRRRTCAPSWPAAGGPCARRPGRGSPSSLRAAPRPGRC